MEFLQGCSPYERSEEHVLESPRDSSYCHCERAQRASVATNRVGRSETLDCFGYRLAMTRNSTHKNIHCHVERKRNILSLRASTTCERGN